MAYSTIAEGRSQEELEELDADIGMIEGPEQVALEMLRAYREAQGLPPLEDLEEFP